MEKYQIEFTAEELQTIGNGLSELPYKVAAPMLNKLQMAIMAADAKRESAKEPEKEV
jgi:hypothetical protein